MILTAAGTPSRHIVLRMWGNEKIDKARLDPGQEAVKIGFSQLRLNLKHLEDRWPEVLVDVLNRMA